MKTGRPAIRPPCGIGAEIRRLRLLENWSIATLALKVGVSDTSVSKWELGYGIPSERNLARLGYLFGVPLAAGTKAHSRNGIVSCARLVRAYYAANPEQRARLGEIVREVENVS